MIWLASYPRSGNTMLRSVLWHCFGLRSGSVYRNDLGGDAKLEERCGHVEWDGDRIVFTHQQPIIKTHEPPIDDSPAIYMVREGRAACVSMWKFYDRAIPLVEVVAGNHRFGSWSAHLAAWQPWKRPDTLFIDFDQACADPTMLVDRVSRFIEVRPVCRDVPGRDGGDGRWVKAQSAWMDDWTDEAEQVYRLTLAGAGVPLPKAYCEWKKS
jgi:hypothetical protein